MSSDFPNIEPIKPINMIDQSILAEIAQENQITLPPQEQSLLEKSKEISQDIVDTAQQRQERWRNNIQRMRDRKEEQARVRESIRTDQGLAARKVDEFRAEKVKDKTIEERREIREKIEENEARKTEERARQQEQIDERRAEKAARAEIQAERALKRKETEPTPEEFRERIDTRLEKVTEKAREITEDRREKRKELVTETEAARREEVAAFKERLNEKVLEVDEIERVQKERTIAKNEIDKSADEFRSERREDFVKIKAKRDENVEEKMQPTLRHFKKLEQRMVEILESSHTNRIESRKVLKEIISLARERSGAALLASGNPLALAQNLSNIEFFGIVRQRINDILTTSDEMREDAIDNKETIVTNARERRDKNMFLSGNPKELFKVLGSIKFFELRRNKEIFEIIKRARERSDYNDTLVGLPAEKRRELHRILHRIMSLLVNPVIIHDTFDQNILSIARKNPDLILRSLVEKILEYVFRIKNSFIFIREVEYSINRIRRPKIEDTNREFNPVIQKAALQSLLKAAPIDSMSGMDMVLESEYPNIPTPLLRQQKTLLMIDYLISVMKISVELEDETHMLNRRESEVDADKIDTLLKQVNLKSVLDSFVPNKAETAEKIIQDNLAEDTEIDTVTTAYIMSLLPADVPTEVQTSHLSDEIYTIIEAPLTYFDSLGKEIKANTGQELFPDEKVMAGKSIEEEKNETLEQEKRRIEKTDNKSRINANETRREYLMQLIEEQNKTAHEKVNDERNLLDLFF